MNRFDGGDVKGHRHVCILSWGPTVVPNRECPGWLPAGIDLFVGFEAIHMSKSPEGRPNLQLKTHWKNGATHVIFGRQEFMVGSPL